MQTRKLGTLTVSSVGLGCMGMSHAYGSPLSSSEVKKVITEAFDIGYTFFDTAEVYGTPLFPHHNEEVLGDAFHPFRKEIVIATKFGLKFDFSRGTVPYPLIPDSSPKAIRLSIEGSLKRLKTDYIDLYLQHRIDPQVSPEEVAGVMNELIKEGKILHWGISEANEEYLIRAHDVCPVTAIENRYSMMALWYERLFPLLEKLNIGFIAYSPLANGFLSDRYSKESKFDNKEDYRASMPQYTEEGFEKNRELLNLIRNIAKEKDATPAQISLAWMLCKKPYIVPIPGSRNYERLKENFDSSKINLSKEEVERIDIMLGHIPRSKVFGEK